MRVSATGDWRVLVFLVVGVALGCSGDGLERYDDVFCRAAIKKPGAAEAMEWLRTSSSEPKRLGTLSSEESLALVDRFDSAGAKAIIVVGPALESKPADASLVVELPADPSRRLAVFELYAKQVRNLGFQPMADLGQAYLYIPARP